MPNINEILDFYFTPGILQNAANKLFLANFTSLIEKRTNRLRKITQDFGESEFKFDGNLIQRVFHKFKANINKGIFNVDNFDKRELRTLTYSLFYAEQYKPAIITKEEELEVVLQGFEKDWRDSHLKGLIDCYLKNWDVKKYEKSILIVGKFILRKLQNYEGNRKVLKSFKDNAKYFNRFNGDVVLGNDLVLKNQAMKDSVKYLSVPEHWFGYPYFSKVISTYYDKKNILLFIDELSEILKDHNYKVTNKRIVSRLITEESKNGITDLKDKVKSIAYNFVGDPSNNPNWRYNENDNVSDKEKDELKAAQSIFNAWLTKQFVNVFFEKCINDKRRKKFWLKYANDDISEFKVFGSEATFRLLKQDKRITEFVDLRFHKLRGSGNIAAFMMHIKNYRLIEFSDPGYAFYAYKKSNPKAPTMDENYLSIDWFRDSDLPMLVHRQQTILYDYKNEGRLHHRDGGLDWEDVFDNWINKMVKINV